MAILLGGTNSQDHTIMFFFQWSRDPAIAIKQQAQEVENFGPAFFRTLRYHEQDYYRVIDKLKADSGSDASTPNTTPPISVAEYLRRHEDLIFCPPDLTKIVGRIYQVSSRSFRCLFTH